MQQILETIGVNDGQAKSQYERKIELLSQENNVLITHLENMKPYKDRYDYMLDEKNQELENA
jgi:hypothetical protein